MPRVTVPREGTTVCAACRKPRGNSRRGWVPILRGSELLGYTCPECPEASEPIRRLESTSGGVRFRAVVDATPPGATRRRQATSTEPTLETARAFVARVRAEVRAAGAYAPPPPESVGVLAERWLASRVDVRPVTVEGYRFALAAVTRKIGHQTVQSLTAADVRQLVADLSATGGRPGKNGTPRPLSPRAVRGSLAALVSVLEVAVADGLVERNVARGVKRPRLTTRVGADLEHWQPTELLTFRAHADTDPLAAAWRLTLCGMRRSEVMGLRWADVNLTAGTVTVNQGRVQLQYGGQRTHVDAPKSAASRRVLPVEQVHPGTAALLAALRRQQLADQIAAGMTAETFNPSGYVVVDALGEPIRPEVYSDRFRLLCPTAGAPRIRLHSVRHSLAFWLHGLGVSPADAAAFLGHGVLVHLATYLPGSGTAGIGVAAAAIGQVSVAA